MILFRITNSSAVLSIGAGAVSDVAAPNERGKYMAVFQCELPMLRKLTYIVGVMLGPAVGPFLGGLFAQTLGWRSIFWFLVIASVSGAEVQTDLQLVAIVPFVL